MGEDGFARLRTGHLAALTCHRHVIHFRSASNPSSQRPIPNKSTAFTGGAFAWWGKMDSNTLKGTRSLRSRRHYRLRRMLLIEYLPPQNKKPILSDELFAWWGKMDSNHRRHCQQIYSLSPLATREFPHMNLRLRKQGVLRWSWWTDSNPRPADYKSAALPAELHQRFRSARL